MAKHAARPGFYTFTQLMRLYGMPVATAKRLWEAGIRY